MNIIRRTFGETPGRNGEADSSGGRGEPLAEVRDCGRIVMDNVRIEGFRNPVIVAYTPVAVEVRGGTPVTVNRGKSNQGKDR